MPKMLITILIILLAVLGTLFCWFFLGQAPVQKNITWGVNFSQMQAESLGLDWKQMYLAMLQDLRVKHIKLLTQWDWIEGKEGNYFFGDVDWQLDQAQKNGAQVMYVVGMKTGRWPECHVPGWAGDLAKQQQQEQILQYITIVVNRYKGNKAISVWQVENEPLFNFGQCPWYDKDFLKKEVALVKQLDPSRQVVISDSGEQSLWTRAAKIGDIVSVTMYRKLWFGPSWIGFYGTFPIPPALYYKKAQLIKKVFGKEVICTELQAEPWASHAFVEVSLEEQAKTMNVSQFNANVDYAKKTGFNQFYFWGVEWWYWLKEKHGDSGMWNRAKELIQS